MFSDTLKDNNNKNVYDLCFHCNITSKVNNNNNVYDLSFLLTFQIISEDNNNKNVYDLCFQYALK